MFATFLLFTTICCVAISDPNSNKTNIENQHLNPFDKLLLQSSPAKEPGPLGGVARLCDEQPDGVGSDFLVAWVYPNVTPFIFSLKQI